MTFNLRCYSDLSSKRFDNEGFPTLTSEEQEKVEKAVEKIFLLSKKRTQCLVAPRLLKWEHGHYLKNCLHYLPASYECLDASRAWLCYWILHGLSLLNTTIDDETKSAVARFLAKCQNPGGGFGGGPGQYSHLATTYAAVQSLCILGTEEAYNVINRETLQRFLWRVRSPEGSFCMHEGGEVDIRGVYCALVVATLTNIASDDLFSGTAEWIVGCQTYEGGFSGCPGMEAHGGYTFCGLAALELLRKSHLCDLKALLRWTAFRQMRLEGGFQGRTNKLVDNCYSFWQGSIFAIMNAILARENPDFKEDLLMNQEALQEYILLCCQHSSGGLFDKPGKPRDVYHTCYGLSGLSVAEYPTSNKPDEPYMIGANNGNNFAASNEIVPTNPYFNMVQDVTYNAIRYFATKPSPKIQKESDYYKQSSESRETSVTSEGKETSATSEDRETSVTSESKETATTSEARESSVTSEECKETE